MSNAASLRVILSGNRVPVYSLGQDHVSVSRRKRDAAHAIVTLALIALYVLAWVLVQGAGTAVPLAASVCNLGLIPAS